MEVKKREVLIDSRMKNQNFQSIPMNQKSRIMLATRGFKLSEKEWDNVCLRFIQRSEKEKIDPIEAYFTTLIKNKAKPRISKEKLLEMKQDQRMKQVNSKKELCKKLIEPFKVFNNCYVKIKENCIEFKYNNGGYIPIGYLEKNISNAIIQFAKLTQQENLLDSLLIKKLIDMEDCY